MLLNVTFVLKDVSYAFPFLNNYNYFLNLPRYSSFSYNVTRGYFSLRRVLSSQTYFVVDLLIGNVWTKYV